MNPPCLDVYIYCYMLVYQLLCVLEVCRLEVCSVQLTEFVICYLKQIKNARFGTGLRVELVGPWMMSSPHGSPVEPWMMSPSYRNWNCTLHPIVHDNYTRDFSGGCGGVSRMTTMVLISLFKSCLHEKTVSGGATCTCTSLHSRPCICCPYVDNPSPFSSVHM